MIRREYQPRNAHTATVLPEVHNTSTSGSRQGANAVTTGEHVHAGASASVCASRRGHSVHHLIARRRWGPRALAHIPAGEDDERGEQVPSVHAPTPGIDYGAGNFHFFFLNSRKSNMFAVLSAINPDQVPGGALHAALCHAVVACSRGAPRAARRACWHHACVWDGGSGGACTHTMAWQC